MLDHLRDGAAVEGVRVVLKETAHAVVRLPHRQQQVDLCRSVLYEVYAQRKSRQFQFINTYISHDEHHLKERRMAGCDRPVTPQLTLRTATPDGHKLPDKLHVPAATPR